MQALYEKVIALLAADNNLADTGSLAAMLHTITGTDDPRIYKQSVQAHVQAGNTDIRWITIQKLTEEAEPCEQTQAVKLIDFAVDVWAREDTREVAEKITERVQDLLDNARLATAKLLAWYCRWLGDDPPDFERETLTWHIRSRYTCMVCLVEDV